jgi:pimeloyl-ACP methyl ester carboxylesterase
MWVLPIPLLLSTLLGLLSMISVVWSFWVVYRLARKWRHRRERTGPCFTDRERPLLMAAVLVIMLSLGGRPLAMLFLPPGGDPPRHQRAAAGRYLARPDGTRLYVETLGPQDAPTMVLTHGWGTDADLWYYVKRDLAAEYRIVTWDLPGLGNSGQPRNRDYSLDKMAEDLNAVLSVSHGPVILVGHSIGGMINLTFCRRYPGLLGSKVLGMVEMNSTYTNPTRTTKSSGMSQALQKPLAEPMLYATIALSPVVRVMNVMRYYNGMSHVQNALQSFAGTATGGQVDFVSRYEILSTPSVVARGGLAMFHWDASAVPSTIPIPVLLLAGDRDTTTVPAASEHMQRGMKQAHLTVISPAKHMGLLERNHEYNAAVLAFARQCFRADVK